MALLLITNPPSTLTVSSQWGDFVNRSDKNMLGYGLSIPVFSLTNWDASTTKPQIASGSIIEVGGSFYQADSDTALTDDGGLSDGTCHIKLVVAGGGASVVPTLTNDAIPVWDADKVGWYSGTTKFLSYEMTKASAVYGSKGEYQDQNKYIKFNVNSSGLGIGNQIIYKKYYKATSPTGGAMFTALSSWVPTTGSVIPAVGNVSLTGTNKGVLLMLSRQNSTTIRVTYISIVSGAITTHDIASGSTSVYGINDIMSNFDELV